MISSTLIADGNFNYSPGLAKRSDGLIVAVYRGAGHLEGDKGIIFKRTSLDGKTWSAPSVVRDDPVNNVSDPQVMVASDGTIVVSFFTSDPVSGNNLLSYTTRSTDGGDTWSEPALLPATTNTIVSCSAPPIEMPDGSLLQATYGSNISVLKSTDKGISWVEIYTRGASGDTEPNLVLLNNGTILMLIRRATTIAQCVSLDSGKTFGTITTAFAGTGAPRVTRLADGLLVTSYRSIYNSASPVGIRYAKNDLVWSAESLINSPANILPSRYASILELTPGCLAIAWAVQRNTNACDIFYQQFNESDLVSPPFILANGACFRGNVTVTNGLISAPEGDIDQIYAKGMHIWNGTTYVATFTGSIPIAGLTSITVNNGLITGYI